MSNQKQRRRAPGGGRKRLIATDDTLASDLNSLISPAERFRHVLRWSCKSSAELAERLKANGHRISQRSVCNILTSWGYDLRLSGRPASAASAATREEQFFWIVGRVVHYQNRGNPAVVLNVLTGPMSPTSQRNFRGVSADVLRTWLQHLAPQETSSRAECLVIIEGGACKDMRSWVAALQGVSNELATSLEVCIVPPAAVRWEACINTAKLSLTLDGRVTAVEIKPLKALSCIDASQLASQLPRRPSKEWNFEVEPKNR